MHSMYVYIYIQTLKKLSKKKHVISGTNREEAPLHGPFNRFQKSFEMENLKHKNQSVWRGDCLCFPVTDTSRKAFVLKPDVVLGGGGGP